MFGPKDKTPAELEAERHADPKNDCPQWRAPCREHKCRWFIQVIGKNPNTGANENRWDCSIAWLPILQIEMAQQARQAGASADKVATEVRKFHNKMVQMNLGAAHETKMNALLESSSGGSGDDRGA